VIFSGSQRLGRAETRARLAVPFAAPRHIFIMDVKPAADMGPEEKVAMSETPPPKSGWRKFKDFAFRKKMLVFWTLGGVVVGIALGAGLYSVHPSKIAIEIIGEHRP
jgi:hypothetical protein